MDAIFTAQCAHNSLSVHKGAVITIVKRDILDECTHIASLVNVSMAYACLLRSCINCIGKVHIIIPSSGVSLLS